MQFSILPDVYKRQIVGCVVYLVGYLTGIIPTDSVDSTFLPSLMSSFGISLVITNLGTMMNLEELIREWKTVVISLAGLVGVAVILSLIHI